ncbi:hypothetical protein U9M48_013424 [Paspalum notatum var. saurae]|uniref:WW domain-containing protein n=1 Tax=Paspalum notatum var. saurae TaxID=547442 RepID=A0AAQ3WJP8_PASNO
MGGDIDRRRSTSDLLFFLGGCAIAWQSMKQRIVALSTCKAEYVAAVAACCQAVWLRRLLREVIGEEPRSPVLRVDNNSAIELAKNPVLHDRSKHINIQFHYIRECVAGGQVVLVHVDTAQQLADLLTKPLGQRRLAQLMVKIGVEEIAHEHKDQGKNISTNLDEPRGRHMPPDSWRPSSPRSMASNQYNNFVSDNPLALIGGAVTSADTAAFRPPIFPGNGSLSSQTAVPTSSHMGMNPPMVQGHHLGSQQIPPMQKLPGPQNFPVQLQNAQQGQHLQGPIPQIGQLQVPQSMGPVYSQNMPSMQLPGQPPASQPLMQQNTSLQAPSVQSNSVQTVPGQQQLPTSVDPQMLQQSMQQMPSQAPQLLLQQQAALQSSYQSSQQAIYQLQQQLQLMQQQSNLNQQPAAQVSKQQAGQTVQSSTPGGTPGATIPTNINAIPQQVGSPAVSLTCNWTEHTSPEGFKYYYNSITRESKWEKPEDYVLYEQQQQQQQQKLLLLQQHQQKIAVQQLQSPPQGQSLPSMQPVQQLPQAQGQTQMQMKQQLVPLIPAGFSRAYKLCKGALGKVNAAGHDDDAPVKSQKVRKYGFGLDLGGILVKEA